MFSPLDFAVFLVRVFFILEEERKERGEIKKERRVLLYFVLAGS
jgi:hypothetical protein